MPHLSKLVCQAQETSGYARNNIMWRTPSTSALMDIDQTSPTKDLNKPAQGNEPMSMEYNGYRPSLKLTVSAPYAHRFSPSWDHLSVVGSKS